MFCDWWCHKHGLQDNLLARLREFVSFIVNVYFPCWFHVNHSWVDGLRNILFELSCLCTQPKEVQLTFMLTVQSSAWFAHSEAILMTMLCSKEEEEERRFAVLKIISIRGEEMGDSSLRLWTFPYLNVRATNLQNLIDWEGATADRHLQPDQI